MKQVQAHHILPSIPAPSLFQKTQRVFFKKFQPLLSRLYKHYTSTKSTYRYRGITVCILPGVFHPQFTFSTKFFVDFLDQLELNDKRILELGCGSGLISLYASQKGARVTASDINPMALESVGESAILNSLSVEPVLSNLFAQLNAADFEYILINPPYYPKEPNNMAENAWFCGEDFQYFQQLFQQLEAAKGEVFIILSEDCQLGKIMDIATNYNFQLNVAAERRIFGELNWIFSLKKN